MQSLLSSLSQSAHDTLYKNMEWTNEQIYLLYDRESPLAILLSDAYRSILPSGSIDREFISPPQPLYRGGLINPDNPYAKSQNRVMTNHNLEENKKTGLDHHETVENSYRRSGSAGRVDQRCSPFTSKGVYRSSYSVNEFSTFYFPYSIGTIPSLSSCSRIQSSCIHT